MYIKWLNEDSFSLLTTNFLLIYFCLYISEISLINFVGTKPYQLNYYTFVTIKSEEFIFIKSTWKLQKQTKIKRI